MTSVTAVVQVPTVRASCTVFSVAAGFRVPPPMLQEAVLLLERKCMSMVGFNRACGLVYDVPPSHLVSVRGFADGIFPDRGIVRRCADARWRNNVRLPCVHVDLRMHRHTDAHWRRWGRVCRRQFRRRRWRQHHCCVEPQALHDTEFHRERRARRRKLPWDPRRLRHWWRWRRRCVCNFYGPNASCCGGGRGWWR